MTWNETNSILGTGVDKADVECESDVIFAALFIGATQIQSANLGRAWRVDMEPNIDKATAKDRTADDINSMWTLQRTCFRINCILRPDDIRKPALVWGLTPNFDRGGMILGGTGAKMEYWLVNKEYAAFAFRYLTASHRAASNNQRDDEMYIGRGAYCGLVIDGQGNAVTAMSTVRTAINAQTADAGNRWKPGLDADIRNGQYGNEARQATWGIIHSLATQAESRQQGMRFFPKAGDQDVPLDASRDVVGYTHGMIRSMYEVERIGLGNAFEMSIGTQTYKLASCVPCSTFMLANGVEASSTHLGRGESWSPLFNGESNNPSHYPNQKDPDELGPDQEKQGITIAKAIKRKNDKHSIFMHKAMTAGVQAMEKSMEWIDGDHQPALIALGERLKKEAKPANTVARDLFLDALTIHKSDLARLDNTLVVIPKAFEDQCADVDLFQGPSAQDWKKWHTEYSDDLIAALHTTPSITYRITAYSDAGASCDLKFVLMDDKTEKQSGTLAQAVGDPTKWFFEFDAANDAVVKSWTIKIGRAAVHPLRLDENTVIDSRHSYIVNSLST